MTATLCELFFDAVDAYGPDAAALRHKVGPAWVDLTYRDVERRVRHVGTALRQLSLERGDRVAILSENRPEWAIVDYACLTTGLVDVPVYPTLTPKQIAYIVNDSGARVVFASTREQFEKLLVVRAELKTVESIIVFDEFQHAGALSMREFEQRGADKAAEAGAYRQEALTITPDALATLIYTSGTTGNPKGVMLSHANFASNVVASSKVLPCGPGDEHLSFLPLSHSFERTAGHYLGWYTGITINYAQSIDTVPQDMLEIRPTILASVPRLYEKMYARILENALARGFLVRNVFFWAKRQAERWADYALRGMPRPGLLDFYKAVADRLVFPALRKRTGGRVKYFVSGSAPLSPVIAKFFYAAGMPIIEGYGLTESSPVISVNPLEAIKIGTVGRPVEGVEVKLEPDGEILARGPNIMQGYWNLPDETAQTITEDGWLRTGDIGSIDADGYITITDRKKDVIKTSGGKMIAPQPIENKVKENKFITNAVMLGDKRKFPLILIVPNFDHLVAWAKHRNLVFSDYRALITLPEVHSKIEREVMGQLRDLAKYEMPKKVVLLDKDFSIEDGELTPTLKVKRRAVEEKHQHLIDRVYEDAESSAR